MSSPQHIKNYLIVLLTLKAKDIINLCHHWFTLKPVPWYLIYHVALYGDLPNLGKIPHMIFCGDTIDNWCQKCVKHWSISLITLIFTTVFTKIKFTDIRWEFIRKDGSSLVVSAYGGKTDIRGTKKMVVVLYWLY